MERYKGYPLNGSLLEKYNGETNLIRAIDEILASNGDSKPDQAEMFRRLSSGLGTPKSHASGATEEAIRDTFGKTKEGRRKHR